MQARIKNTLVIATLSLLPTIFVWIPFFLRLETFWTIPLPKNGLQTIVSNYDGPLYMVVAKTFYNIDLIKNQFSFDLPVEYYAAHFPLFPLLIRLTATITNYPYAMLAVTLISSILAIFFFKKFIRQFVSEQDALWLTAIFSVFPARWLIVRSVGSPEPLFLASIIASIYYFQNKKYWPAALWGVVAQLTKSPGAMLFVAFAGVIVMREFKRLATLSSQKWLKNLKLNFSPIILIPISLVGLFAVYGQTLGDFFAYFRSGDNIHLFFPPFQIFNYSQPWVDTHWLEEIIFVYLLSGAGLIQLIKQKKEVLAWFVGIFFLSIIFVSHRDVMRYSLPIIPFLFAAYADYLTKKEFKYIMALLIIPIYLFSLAFIARNAMPISDWTPLL